ncbi:hypothetical protein [Prochlorococcus sp. MIT 1223]|uniref:hypothetical protein n=1 Tax=Prochlorococcus sp. MIT 1223 TaxID=3096217 RepID=UPI002A754685|nr:hypothetical protein [Prochlorococcus sp. MIT 1223]
MRNPSQNKILAESSAWVAVLLNFIPGLGTGYIYQRRWKAYWITNFVFAAWIGLNLFRDVGIDPNDPIIMNSGGGNLYGIIIFATITSAEAWMAVKKAKDNLSNV